MPKNILNDPKAIVDLLESQKQNDWCIGDVPGYWLKEDFGINLEDAATRGVLTKALEGAGLSHYYVNAKQRAELGQASTTLYAYKKDRLQELLDQNRDMLVKAEWPTTADRFVQCLSYVTAPRYSELFDFIAHCHGDDGNLSKNNTKLTDAEIEINREHVEFSKEKFRELRPDFFKDDEAPSVSNNAGSPSARKNGANLYDMLTEYRGEENINGDLFYQMTLFVLPNAAQKTSEGFKVALRHGGSIEWKAAQEGGKYPRETIQASKEDFNWEHAEAIVTMARVNGWQSIDVHGSKEHKEMLWLAVQRQAMHERYMQLNGFMEKGPLPQVANFKPSKNSAVYKQFLEEKALRENMPGGEKFDNAAAPETNRTNSAPAAAKNEAKTPRDKILRAFMEKLCTHFNKYAENSARTLQRDAAPAKPAGTKSRFHRKPSS